MSNFPSVKGGPGIIVRQGPNGITIRAIKPRRSAGAAVPRAPFEFIRAVNDSGWKATINPGTINGLTPVVGDVEGSGGTALSLTNPVPLTTGEPYICLGIKTDLETREISRLTIQTREDVDPIVDTGARTRIAFVILMELTEGVSPESWTLLSQVATTHLKYFTAGSSDIVWRA